jgi:putative addiction module component (TIGR02574 family)
MIPADLTQKMLKLSVEDRLELARQLMESVVSPATLNEAVADGIRRIEEVASGRVTPLTEQEFQAALQ